eukprot:CAMPEP_0206026250 /NCGR_PEP_ID=MMETSP1464-20131121/41387_1 /ASSEMBLY_ACC=CAM_ASM_001124 /TAXON_ID=119497 /ORGANISM="Exanthemachrysis gayraliae, Strain RCC1523" /LENGTH=48 /DNA_ID= /DNA_START= /DNA_END= /DNA_ORIENTATION=
MSWYAGELLRCVSLRFRRAAFLSLTMSCWSICSRVGGFFGLGGARLRG